MDPKKQIPNTWRYSLRNALYFTTPSQTLVFTTSEASLLVMYQFQNAFFDTAFDIFSFLSAILFTAYYLGFLGYTVWGLNR
jgi:hypothetical protein